MMMMMLWLTVIKLLSYRKLTKICFHFHINKENVGEFCFPVLKSIAQKKNRLEGNCRFIILKDTFTPN